jgi:hypothetical protein
MVRREISACAAGAKIGCVDGISETRNTIRGSMTNIEALERDIEKVTREELAAFREWFIEYDWHAWDRELEQDIAAGKLDKFGSEVLEEFKRGKTKEI